MGKLRASVGWLEMMPKMGHSKQQLGFQMRHPQKMISRTISPDFKGGHVQSVGLKMGPFAS